MARLTPPSGGSLASLSDVDIDAGDGLTTGRPNLAYDRDTELWTPSLATPLSGARSSGPARDHLTQFTVPTVTKAEGSDVAFDGALWSVDGTAHPVRYDPTPTGVAETVGTATMPSDGSATSSQRNALAATDYGLYALLGSNSTHLYRILDENTVTALTAPPFSRPGPLIPVGGGLLHAGRVSSGDPGQAAMYDPFTGGWDTIAQPPMEARGSKGFAYGGRAYLCGSLTGNTHAIVSYDPLTDTWETHNDAPATLNPYSATFVVFGSLVYALGGQASGGDLHLYSPELDVWEQTDPTGAAFTSAGPGEATAAAALGQRIYAVGGAGGGSDKVQVYG